MEPASATSGRRFLFHLSPGARDVQDGRGGMTPDGYSIKGGDGRTDRVR
jgi:hypothetical protein